MSFEPTNSQLRADSGPDPYLAKCCVTCKHCVNQGSYEDRYECLYETKFPNFENVWREVEAYNLCNNFVWDSPADKAKYERESKTRQSELDR